MKTICALAVVAGLLAISAHAAVTIHYEQNFDSLDVGEADGQDGWAVGAPANQASTLITDAENHDGAGQAMEVSANQEVIRNFDPKITSGVHFLSIWFQVAAVDAANNLHIYMGDEVREWNAGPVIRIGSQSGGGFDEVGVHDGGAAQPVAPILEGQWQHIFEVIDVDAHTYDVYVDDDLVADDFAWRNPGSHQSLGWLMLGFDDGVDLIGYYDDIVFGEGDTLPWAVGVTGKLATTWASVKRAR